jgi:AcrR family transcriptional regulator
MSAATVGKRAGSAARRQTGAPSRPAGTRVSTAPAKGKRGRLAARKRPTQARAQQTVEAILEAAIDLFAAQGRERTTTNRIAERAGVSIGSLYQYFPGKEAILAALFDRHVATVMEAVGRSLVMLADPRVPLEAGLRRLILELCAVHDDHPRLTRAVSQHGPEVPQLGVSLRKHEAVQASRIAALLEARGDVRAADRTVMALVLSHATEALTRMLAHDLPAGTDRGAAIDEIVCLLSRYLAR